MTTKGIDRNDGKSNDLAGRQTDVKRIGHETKAVNDLREKLRIIKVLEGLPNFLRVFREGFLVFRYKFMRVLREGLIWGSIMRG